MFSRILFALSELIRATSFRLACEILSKLDPVTNEQAVEKIRTLIA